MKKYIYLFSFAFCFFVTDISHCLGMWRILPTSLLTINITFIEILELQIDCLTNILFNSFVFSLVKLQKVLAFIMRRAKWTGERKRKKLLFPGIGVWYGVKICHLCYVCICSKTFKINTSCYPSWMLEYYHYQSLNSVYYSIIYHKIFSQNITKYDICYLHYQWNLINMVSWLLLITLLN